MCSDEVLMITYAVIYPVGKGYAIRFKPGSVQEHGSQIYKGKRESALEWFAETRYAKPGINALLAKMGFEPVLDEASA